MRLWELCSSQIRGKNSLGRLNFDYWNWVGHSEESHVPLSYDRHLTLQPCYGYANEAAKETIGEKNNNARCSQVREEPSEGYTHNVQE